MTEVEKERNLQTSRKHYNDDDDDVRKQHWRWEDEDDMQLAKLFFLQLLYLF